MSSRGGGAGTMSSKSYQQAVAVVTGYEGGEMSSQFAEWVEIAEETGGHLAFSFFDVLEDWRQDRAQRDAERDDLLALVEKVVRYRNGREEYDFSKLAPQERENAAFDAWLEIEADLNAAIRKARGAK